MMRITAQGQTIEFDDARLTFAEGRALEKITGQPFVELAEQKFVGGLTAIQALVWVVFKRANPTLRFADLDDWNIGGIEIDVDPDAVEVLDGVGVEGEGEGEPDPTPAVAPSDDDSASTAPGSSTQP